MKNRRNLIIYRNKCTGYVGALAFSDDDLAGHIYQQITSSDQYDQVEWFGREYDSYELEVASEDC